ncbi:diguanylate cyclase domain-containing protein [uncultured Pseudokineococcus sp.]|uniref:diguanylate cyclase domain-containing protein n=1 Tax=uncultured Pseudokineococcus sp. TaxID=1642928 RepID=UPI002615E526|nr:diguanylate cyclase [uncultured Pseudokineococcus sp.]
MATGTTTSSPLGPAAPSRPDPPGDVLAGGADAATAADVVRLEVEGDLDLTTSAQLQERIEGAGRSSVRAVVVDLSHVAFIDCHGLGVLLAARTQLGTRLVLLAPAPVVTHLLAMTGTQHHFDAPDAGSGTSTESPDDGPAPSGGTSHGGPATGDSATGDSATGGTATGGTATGGTATGGTATGGTATGDGATDDAATGDPTASSTPWSEEVLRVVTEAVEQLQLERPADLWLATRVEGDHQVVAAAAGPWSGEVPTGTTLPWRGTLEATDDLDGSAWPVTDADELLGRGSGTGRPLGVGGSTGALLLAGEEVVGTVCGFTSRTTTTEDPLDAAAPVVRLLGQVLSLALTAVRAQGVSRDLAETDVLTGLRNRRGWQECLARESGRCSRYGTRAGVVAIDLDGLKATNDTYGHPAGDALLVATAEVLRRTCRPSDVLARPGGDEFAVLAVEADPAALAALSARIGEHLHAAGIPASVAAAPHEVTGPLEDTWARADEQMYAVKALRRTGTATSASHVAEHAAASAVLRFYAQERLLPTSTAPAGEEEERSSTASRLDFIHRARGAGLSPAQVRGALALRHSPTRPSQQLQDLLQARLALPDGRRA